MYDKSLSSNLFNSTVKNVGVKWRNQGDILKVLKSISFTTLLLSYENKFLDK